MTCKVYHIEQRHGHLTPGFIVTASESLESIYWKSIKPRALIVRKKASLLRRHIISQDKLTFIYFSPFSPILDTDVWKIVQDFGPPNLYTRHGIVGTLEQWLNCFISLNICPIIDFLLQQAAFIVDALHQCFSTSFGQYIRHIKKKNRQINKNVRKTICNEIHVFCF